MRKPTPHVVVSKTGRITRPETAPPTHGWAVGTRLQPEETPDGAAPTEASPFPPTRFEDVFGCLAWGGPPKTIDEMDAAVLEMAKHQV